MSDEPTPQDWALTLEGVARALESVKVWGLADEVREAAVHIAELETQLAERETDLERESGRANDNALKIMRLVTRNSALQAQLAEARSEIERRPAPDFFREILKQRNEAEYRLAEANTELQKANDEIRERKRHR